MTGDAFTLQADYVPLAPLRAEPRRAACRRRAAGAETVRHRATSPAIAIEASLPDAVGAFVDWLSPRAGGRSPSAAGDEPVPVQARHICILFRRFISFGDDVTHAVRRMRSKRAASSTCWSAARRFTTVRRSRPFARRSPPSSGRTTSCRCLRRCAGPLFAIGDEELLDWKQRFTSQASIRFRIPPEARRRSAHLARSSTR